MSLEDDLDVAITRLDKQATAIKRLRVDRDKQAQRIADLEATVRFLETAMGGRLLAEVADGERQPVQAEGASSSTGWTMKPTCVRCGGAKEANRDRLLTCKPCGKAYHEQCQKGFTGTREERLTCGQCGTGKQGVTLLCTACSKAFADWKRKAQP